VHGLAIFGITGRMGQSLLRAMQDDLTLRLCGAIASSGSGRLGQDAASEGIPTGVMVTSDPNVGIRGAAVAVDFSSGSSVAAHAKACAAAGIPILIGATGFDSASRAILEEAARLTAVLIAPNTSVGVSLVVKLVAMAAHGLGSSYDVEILDVHHRTKRDAPSGTALALGKAVATARGQNFEEVTAFDPSSGRRSLRVPGSIGISSVRAGDIVGEHTVTFATDGERVEISHRATDRIIFARGALRAAAWLVGKPAGLYGMHDVLGL